MDSRCLRLSKSTPVGFEFDLLLSSLGITVSKVPNIAEREEQRLYELVAAQSGVARLSTRPHLFNLVTNYDPFAPTANDISTYGFVEAKKKTLIESLNIAVEAIHEGWGPGPGECYRVAFVKTPLEPALQGALLNWDIQVSYPYMISSIEVLILPRKPIPRSVSSLRKICSL